MKYLELPLLNFNNGSVMPDLIIKARHPGTERILPLCLHVGVVDGVLAYSNELFRPVLAIIPDDMEISILTSIKDNRKALG